MPFCSMSKSTHNVRSLNHLASYPWNTSAYSWMLGLSSYLPGYFWYAKQGFCSALSISNKILLSSITTAGIISWRCILHECAKTTVIPTKQRTRSSYESITGKFRTDVREIDSVRIFTSGDLLKRIVALRYPSYQIISFREMRG